MKNSDLAQKLLDWYADHGRDLPWRVRGKAHPDPYKVFISEIMLQQTTVKTVIPYFERFIERFPSIDDLAKATQDQVYQYWQGLGYYSRARFLLKTAQIVVNQYNGKFPSSKDEVAKLKGFGPYTIASFLALAYNMPETVIDGNVRRIICRMYHLPQATEDYIKQKARLLTDKKHPADYASAIMDLGATICTPKNPQCKLCPWYEACLSADKEDVEQIPQRLKIKKKEIKGCVFVIMNKNHEVFIRKRTENGLLSGLYEFPWGENLWFADAVDSGKSVTHVFTHIKMVLRIYNLTADQINLSGKFIPIEELANYALSTLMKKVWLKNFNPAQ